MRDVPIPKFHLEICSLYVLIVYERPPGKLANAETKANGKARRPERARTPSYHESPPDAPPPPEWWASVLADPRARGKPWLPIQQRRLSEIPRHVLRVECLRCFRIVEIQTADAIRLYGPHAVYKDVGRRLLDNGCQHRTGRHEEDGCWPEYNSDLKRSI
jgi:hypothetical protein